MPSFIEFVITIIILLFIFKLIKNKKRSENSTTEKTKNNSLGINNTSTAIATGLAGGAIIASALDTLDDDVDLDYGLPTKCHDDNDLNDDFDYEGTCKSHDNDDDCDDWDDCDFDD